MFVTSFLVSDFVSSFSIRFVTLFEMDSDSEELSTVFPLPKYKAPAKKIRNTTTAIINFLSILLPPHL